MESRVVSLHFTSARKKEYSAPKLLQESCISLYPEET